VSKHRVEELFAFGEQLIKTGDLDPIYIALVGAKLPEAQLKRLLLAYFCFYHLGVAAWLSEFEGIEFWNGMDVAARNEVPATFFGIDADRWPRGAERRHFRGEKCVDAVLKLEAFCTPEKGGPEHFIGLLLEMSRMVTFEGILKSIQVFPLFGNWVSFKVADVLERVMGAEIEFPNDITLLYKEPRAALDLLTISPEKANEKLLKYFGTLEAPPRYERFCNIQEVETVCCKWKSMLGGHYHVGKDIHEVRKGLEGWGETAFKLLKCMPPEIELGLFK
jgi:hypothetical protein